MKIERIKNHQLIDAEAQWAHEDLVDLRRLPLREVRHAAVVTAHRGQPSRTIRGERKEEKTEEFICFGKRGGLLCEGKKSGLAREDGGGMRKRQERGDHKFITWAMARVRDLRALYILDDPIGRLVLGLAWVKRLFGRLTCGLLNQLSRITLGDSFAVEKSYGI